MRSEARTGRADDLEADRHAVPPDPDVLCLGETMVLLTTSNGLSLSRTAQLDVHVAGAESNVAARLAHLGHRVEWWGRIGADPLGSRVREDLVGRGVVVDRVAEDDVRPTAVYLKDVGVPRSRVYYYRAGSAASAMSSLDLTDLRLTSRRLCHLTGITPALSPGCADLVREVLRASGPERPLVSFDVNYRPGLWEPGRAAPVLRELASMADVVVVGRDEAASLWGTEGPHDVRALLPEVGHLVVKDDAAAATAFERGPAGEERVTTVPALSVDVVEPVGAGDAFAAGYLSGLLEGWSTSASLRLGHLVAGFTLLDVSDLPRLPTAEALTALALGGDDDWTALRERPLTMEAVGR